MEEAKAIQIITLENHSFKFDPEKLRPFFEHNDLKDRQAVIVSIAGAFRRGKSFLLNFFLKYLYAQYKRHDVSDWIGEHKNGSSWNGFKSRGGPDRETTGIWMWSDIFTHDFDDGNKVAIILIDTQGIFDDKTTMRESTTIFGISTMISSIQCYNVMQNIQEDDLQHLQLFAAYGRLVAEQTNESPFQNLLFIVRDWRHHRQYEFGNGQNFINKILNENDEQSPDMRQLRDQIRTSFKNIDAFLLPFPGDEVADDTWGGNLKGVARRFIDYVKLLAPSLFAPENLVVKSVNGQKMRIRDLVTYLQIYVNTFNSDKLPESKTIYAANAEATNQIFYSECVYNYVDSMAKSLNTFSYLSRPKLRRAHDSAKKAAVTKFQNQRKLGDDNLIASFKCKLESEIEFKHMMFANINARKRKIHTSKYRAIARANDAAQRRAEAVARAEEIRQEQVNLQNRRENLEQDLRRAERINAVKKFMATMVSSIIRGAIRGVASGLTNSNLAHRN